MRIARVIIFAEVCGAALLVGGPALANSGTTPDLSPHIGRAGGETGFLFASTQDLRPRVDTFLTPVRGMNPSVDSTNAVPVRMCLDAAASPDLGVLPLSRKLSATITADTRRVMVGLRHSW